MYFELQLIYLAIPIMAWICSYFIVCYKFKIEIREFTMSFIFFVMHISMITKIYITKMPLTKQLYMTKNIENHIY